MKIKVSSPSRYSREKWGEFFPKGEQKIGDAEFFVNEQVEEADFWFVIEGTLPDDSEACVPRNRVVFLQAEIARPLDFFCNGGEAERYLSQFSRVFGPIPCFAGHYENVPPFLPWFVNSADASDQAGRRDWDFFNTDTPVDKREELSMILSAKSQHSNHRVRFQFAERLSQHLGKSMHWFGNGINNIPNKWDGLAPYRHTIVLENSQIRNGITEKVIDSALCLTRPIYAGAPNLNDYFPERYIVKIDIADLDFSIHQIERTLAQDEPSPQLTDLLAFRSLALEKFSLFHRIYRLAIEIAADEVSENPQLRSISPQKLQPTRRGALSHLRRAISLPGIKLQRER